MQHLQEKNEQQEINRIKQRQFWTILEQELIYPVYQPIVSLKDGEILGYEALSRFSLDNAVLNPEEFFHLADELGCLWRVEELCRRKALQHAVDKRPGTKLFLNVDPDVMKDEQFREGITCRYLRQYRLLPEDIVFEITEHNSIEDEDTFLQIIQHYRDQDFQIAIDDFGNGYAGMNRICALKPQFVKIDMKIVAGIDNDNMKKSMVESMVQLCKKTGIFLIAEGIETKDELKTLIKLGVHYGQGYYLLRPQPQMESLPCKVVDYIRNVYDSEYTYNPVGTTFGTVGEIARIKETIRPEQQAGEVFRFFQKKTSATDVTVVDTQDHVLGVLTRTIIMDNFGGMYGYEMSRKKMVSELMDDKPLIVDASDSIEKVSRMALARPQRTLYDAVIVTKNQIYDGVVTVKDLLESVINIKVHRAVEASPLTGLPGNAVIDSKVADVIAEGNPFTIVYIDLDNFKAYNDAYGFGNGDLMIKALAESMKENCVQGEFLGHIGGDDFVLIADRWESEEFLQTISDDFQRRIAPLYSEEDYKRGCIVSHNRRGQVEEFPIATLSMAVLTNRQHKIANMEEFAELLVKAKHESKLTVGNSYTFME